MFWIAASLLNLEMTSPMTAHLLVAAQLATSFFLRTASPFSAAFGKAVAKRVEIASTTMRFVFPGGNEVDRWVRRASRCGKVGAVKWWKSSNNDSEEQAWEDFGELLST